jgi:perosamine synthetase
MPVQKRSRQALALDGGSAVRDSLLPYGRQSIGEDDIAAVVEVLRSDWLTTGPKIAEFEERFASAVGARFAVSFSSGTGALHGAAFAAGLTRGDEAITSPLTFAATANCILYQGATPVFADVRPDILTLDPEQVASKLTSRTRAILPVDYAGHPADMDDFREIADRAGAVVIEDACHSLGAEYRDRRVGSLAHMTVFSFHPVKHITTGEGGMVTTDDSGFAETLRRFRNHGISTDARQRQQQGQWEYEMVLLGFNYRLTDIACALGLRQLEKLSANLRRRRLIADIYRDAFAASADLFHCPVPSRDVQPAWHLYPIRLHLENLTVSRAEIFQALRAENIGVNVHYIPVHLHPYYRDRFTYDEGSFPVAESAYQQLVSIPMYHGMTDDDVQDVIAAVNKVVKRYAINAPSTTAIRGAIA